MTKINWINTTGENDWFGGANWQGGSVPGAADIANIGTAGFYKIDIDGAVTVDKLRMDAQHTILTESSTSSINARVFEMLDGTAILHTANTIHSAVIDGGLVVIGDDHSLGVKPITFGQSGSIEADNANLNLHNTLDYGEARLSAHDGDILNVSGALVATESDPGATALTEFGTDVDRGVSGDFANGTIVITSTSFTLDASSENVTLITGCTVKSGVGAHSIAADEIFSDSSILVVDTGATLDVRNFGTDVTLNNMGMGGTLIGDADTLIHALNPSAGGTLDNVHMEVSGSGNFDPATLGNSQFIMAAGTNTVNFLGARSGNITISAPDGSTSTVTVGSTTTEHFTDFQDGNLTIEIGQTGVERVTFIEDAGDTRMVVHPGHGVKAFSLYFDGVTSPDDLTLGTDGHGHLQVTWGGAGEAPAHATHDIEVTNQVAQALLVPAGHDVF